VIEETVIDCHLVKIAKKCEAYVNSGKKIGLYNGLGGVALFLFYYSKYTGDEHFGNVANKALGRITQELSASKNNFSYCSGIAGFGWLISHLQKANFLKEDFNELLNQLDPYLIKALDKFLEMGHYDFLNGYLGVYYYFLENDFEYDERSKNLKSVIVEKVINKLYDTAIIDGKKISWKSYTNRNSSIMGVNLGLAHGLPSIIMLLLKTYASKKDHKVRSLIVGAIEYLKAVQSSYDNDALYSSFIYDGEYINESSGSRLAWCYGDLGVGLSFNKVGMELKIDDITNRSLMIFEMTISRKATELNGVYDASFCHGSSGLTFIYNKIYEKTNLPDYKLSCQYWLNQTLDIINKSDYKAWFHSTGYRLEHGILEGVSGIGLSLLSIVDRNSRGWEEAFLI